MDQELLVGLVGVVRKVWVDDVVFTGRTPGELLQNILAVMQRLLDRGLNMATHKCHFFTRFVTWCGKVY